MTSWLLFFNMTKSSAYANIVTFSLSSITRSSPTSLMTCSKIRLKNMRKRASLLILFNNISIHIKILIMQYFNICFEKQIDLYQISRVALSFQFFSKDNCPSCHPFPSQLTLMVSMIVDIYTETFNIFVFRYIPRVVFPLHP